MSTETITHCQCHAPERAGGEVYGGRYRRLFDGLPALDADEEALHALGRPGGLLDQAAAAAETDATVAAGWPLFGPFVAHGLPADRSPLGRPTHPPQHHTLRAPTANTR